MSRLRFSVPLLALSLFVLTEPVAAQFAQVAGVGLYSTPRVQRRQGDSYNLTLTRGAAAIASSRGTNAGGCLTGCSLSKSILRPIRQRADVPSAVKSDGTGASKLVISYVGFGVPSAYLVDQDVANASGLNSNAIPLDGETVIEVSSVATRNPEILASLPNIDPAALAAVNAQLQAAGGDPDSTGTGKFVCQLEICTPAETRDAAAQGLVPIPRYNEAYTNFVLTQEVESTDVDFINNFLAAPAATF